MVIQNQTRSHLLKSFSSPNFPFSPFSIFSEKWSFIFFSLVREMNGFIFWQGFKNYLFSCLKEEKERKKERRKKVGRCLKDSSDLILKSSLLMLKLFRWRKKITFVLALMTVKTVNFWNWVGALLYFLVRRLFLRLFNVAMVLACSLLCQN